MRGFAAPEKPADRVSRGGKSIEPDDDIYNDALARLRTAKQSKRKLSYTSAFHVCRPSYCDPENESSLIRQGLLKGPPLTDNVYLCNLGAVHVCTKKSCNLYAGSHDNVCPISGLQAGNIYSSYSKHDGRTWYTRPEFENIGSSKINSVFVQQTLIASAVDKRRLLTQSGSMVDVMKQQRRQATKRLRKASSLSNTTTASQVPPPAPPAPCTPTVKEHLPSGKVYKRVKRTTYNRATSIKTVRTKAKGITRLLLFSNNRQRLNDKARAMYEKQALDARDTYIKGCMTDGVFAFLTDIYRLMANKRSQPLPLQIFEFDQTLFDYYVDVICQVWKLITKYYVHPKQKQYDEDTGDEIVPKINVEHVCIGVLYNMQRGWKYKDTYLLPLDDFLFCNLPRVNDLPEFNGIGKPACTSGTSILKQTYENAIASKVPLSDLTIKVEHLKETTRYENGEKVDTMPKVFMCTSRKPKLK